MILYVLTKVGDWRTVIGSLNNSNQAGKEKTMSTAQKQKVCVHIRWMIRRDMPEVMRIENISFEFPWSEEEFIRSLRQRGCIGMVAEHDERVVGFMIYELHRDRLHIVNFAVHPEFRHRGVGTALVRKLAGKLSEQRRNHILLEIRETNLVAQLFFRFCGFKAGSDSVLHNFYEDSSEDAYLMRLFCRFIPVHILPPELPKESLGELMSEDG